MTFPTQLQRDYFIIAMKFQDPVNLNQTVFHGSCQHKGFVAVARLSWLRTILQLDIVGSYHPKKTSPFGRMFFYPKNHLVKLCLVREIPLFQGNLGW